MPPLTPEAQRLRIIILSFPLFVGTSYVLYKRAFKGEEQRQIPRTLSDDKVTTERISILGRGVGMGGIEERQPRPSDWQDKP
ncbi:hypothetical protein NliqN6_5212 [Naganishia liquefaciens]|uniref:Uncharacterized protein n=1 Tax=Naganishia liquefaciens TaxID=104408 RepID=A0A8H3YGF8_9TREE|nr:hypothetical protein NliqN6_5212 [Naganishia liquefaciens]